jgi:hypothetical protein
VDGRFKVVLIMSYGWFMGELQCVVGVLVLLFPDLVCAFLMFSVRCK